MSKPFGKRGLSLDVPGEYFLDFGEAPLLPLRDGQEGILQAFLRFQGRRCGDLKPKRETQPEYPQKGTRKIALKIRDIDDAIISHWWFEALMGEYLDCCSVKVDLYKLPHHYQSVSV